MSRLGSVAGKLPDSPDHTIIHRVFVDAWRGRDAAARDRPRILVALVRVQEWRPWLAQARDLLDATEQDRIQRRRNPDDRELATLAYALHRAMLAAVLGMDPRQVPLYRDGQGRPRLAGEIACTSLSHAEDAIAIAVARARVGVDIEPASRARGMDEIASRVCHAREFEAISRLPEGRRASALLALWVRKEAALKAAGVGLATEMDTFIAADHALAGLPGDPASYEVRMLDAGLDWCAAVAGPVGADVEYAWTGPHGVPRYYRLSPGNGDPPHGPGVRA